MCITTQPSLQKKHFLTDKHMEALRDPQYSRIVFRRRLPRDEAGRYFVARLFSVDPRSLNESVVKTILSDVRDTARLLRMCFRNNCGLGQLTSERYFELCELYQTRAVVASPDQLDTAMVLWNRVVFQHKVRGREELVRHIGAAESMNETTFQQGVEVLLRCGLVWQSGVNGLRKFYGLPMRNAFRVIGEMLTTWCSVKWEIADFRYSAPIENRVARSFKRSMARSIAQMDVLQKNGRYQEAIRYSCHWIDAQEWHATSERAASFPLSGYGELKSNRIVVWNAHLLSVHELELFIRNIDRLYCCTLRKPCSWLDYGVVVPIQLCFARDAMFHRGEERALDNVTRFLEKKFSKTTPGSTTGVSFSSHQSVRHFAFDGEVRQQCALLDVYRRYAMSGELIGPPECVSKSIAADNDDCSSSLISFCGEKEFAALFWSMYCDCRMIFVSVTRDPASRCAINHFVFDTKRERKVVGAELAAGLFENITYKSTTSKLFWRIKQRGVDSLEAVPLWNETPAVLVGDPRQYEIAECVFFEELHHSVPFVVVMLDEFARYPAEQCMTRYEMYDLMCMVTQKLIFIGTPRDFPHL